MNELNNPLELIPVLRDLHNISGFRISVHDTGFNEVAAYPEEQSPFCRLIKAGEKTRLSCKESDRRAFLHVQKTGQTYLYQCDFGLYDAVAPLYSLGQLSGYLVMGQTLDTVSGGRDTVYKNAAPYAADREELREAVEKIHIRAKENILSCLSIMGICAEYITLTNRLNSTKKDLAAQCRRYIDESFAQKITIDLLCSRFFCSRATLITAFSNRYKVSINHYLTRARVERARQLLQKTEFTVSIIAEQCGFSDQNYFSKVFYKETGKTPTAFRKESNG